MQINKFDEDYAASGQIDLPDLPYLAKTGFRSVVCLRPDQEGGTPFGAIRARAEDVGLKSAYVPFSGDLTPGVVSQFKQAMAKLPKPVLGYCASGNRATTLYRTFKAS